MTKPTKVCLISIQARKLLFFLSFGNLSCNHILSVNNRNQRKVIKMLVTVVLLFGLCWLPYHIVYMYAEFSLSQLTPPFISFILFAQWLMFTNSACNPIVYAVLNNNFRGAFLSILSFSSRKQPRRRRRTASTSVQVVQSAQ